jgi:hypothetical protein
MRRNGVNIRGSRKCRRDQGRVSIEDEITVRVSRIIREGWASRRIDDDSELLKELENGRRISVGLRRMNA